MTSLVDWPFPAKILAVLVASVAAFLLWSALASISLHVYLYGLHGNFALAEWWSFHAYYPDPRRPAPWNASVQRGLTLSAFSAFGLPATVAVLVAAKELAPRLAHDNAAWATWWDIRRAGFSSRVGLYLGRVGGRWLRLGHARQRKHIAIIAPTQSGKGVGYVLPLGLCDPPEKVSPLFFDPKWQAFTKTAGWQKSIGANVILFAPLSPTGQTAQYNPCFYVRRLPDGGPTVDTWGDIEDIVHAQIERGEGPQQFWNDTSRNTYAAMLAFLSETAGAEFTIPGALDLMFRSDGPEYIRQRLDEHQAAGKPYSKPCADNLRDFLGDSEELRSGVRKTITAKLGIFFNPRVRAAVSGNTFDLTKFMKERTAFYFCVAFGDMDKLGPLIALFFQQLVDLGTRVPPGADPSVAYEMPVVLDEFANMRKMDKIMQAFSYVAEYGFRLIPIFQTPSQLEDIYKLGAKRILDNCKVKVVLGGIDDMGFCQTISDRLGTTKGERRSSSGPILGGIADLFKGNASRSAIERPLLSKYEVSQLPDDEAIVLHGGRRGILAKRIRYYDTAPFKGRVMPAPDVPELQIDLRYDWPPEDLNDDASADDPVSLPVPAGEPAANAPAEEDTAPDGGLALKRPPAKAAKPAAKPVKPKASRGKPKKPADDLEMSVKQAEATLLAVSGNRVDLSQFGLSPAAAKAQIDLVVHNLPTLKGRKP